MSTTLNLNMFKKHNSSKKSFSVFMLFSMMVCCVASVISCVDNYYSAFQTSEFSHSSIGYYSGTAKKNLALAGIEKFCCALDSDTPAEFSCRNYKRNNFSSSSKPKTFISSSNFEINEFPLFLPELKRLENNKRIIIKENVGISERFQV